MRSVGVTRRRFLTWSAAAVGASGVAAAGVGPLLRAPKRLEFPATDAGLVEQVLPEKGVATGVRFAGSLQKLIAAGVIDPDKFRAAAGEVPAWVERLLVASSDDPIVFNRDTARYLVDLLWPIGLANRATLNENTSLNTVRIPSFASTGGWTLGRQPNGYVYFNNVGAVPLSGAQQVMVLAVARGSYRPCCDNSTLFQDCNHGSALLGLLELAASQGATLPALYRLALTANAYWFPDNYARTALYFSHFRGMSWGDIDPRLVLGPAYSSASGWQLNVSYPLRRANLTLPGSSTGQRGC